MAWNQQRAMDRIKQRDFSASEVMVTELTRDREFENIGPKEAVDVQGVHAYVDYSGFREAVEAAGENKEKQKKMLRALDVLARMADHIVSLHDDSKIIQQQGSRTHFLTYKPYGEESERAALALLKAIDLLSYGPIFNSVFEEEIGQALAALVGCDAGRTFVVNVGKKGCRELLSLGGPASVAAKNLGDPNTITISKGMFDVLPADLRKLFTCHDHGAGVIYVFANASWKSLEKIQHQFDHGFDEEALLEKTLEFKTEFKLDEVDIAGATEKIDFERLSGQNVKRLDSISIFVDVDGFTAMMDKVETSEDAKEMVRLFTGIRSELEEVLTVDFSGVKVQQRGDCILVNIHIPSDADSESDRTEDAVEAAVGVMSSLKLLNKYYQPSATLRLQVGEASGKTFFTRIGKKGAKSPALVGHAEDRSETLQQDCVAGEIRICEKTYGHLPEGTLRECFQKILGKDSYVAKNLTMDGLVEAEDDGLRRAAFDLRARSEVVKPGLLKVGAASNRNEWKHVNTVPHLSGKK